MGHFEGDPSGKTHGVAWIESSPQELAAFALRMVVERIGFRIDAMNERGLPGVSISKGFATEIVGACKRAAHLLDPEPARAGLIAGGGPGNANVSGGVTGGGERAAGDAAGEIGGHMELPPVDDPAAETLCDDCPPVGYPTDKTRCLPCPRRREESSGLCLAGLAAYEYATSGCGGPDFPAPLEAVPEVRARFGDDVADHLAARPWRNAQSARR